MEEIADHLLGCERCVAMLETLRPTDLLIESLRGHRDSAGLRVVDQVDDLIKQLSRLPAPAPSVLSQAPQAATRIPEETQELHRFFAPPQSPEEIGRLGDYRLLEVLGSGGMGVVFLADDPQLQRRVALKVMKPVLAASPAARQRFVREARAIAAIEHRHIVRIHHIGEDRGLPFLVMQLLEGESLEDRLRRQSAEQPGHLLPVAEVIEVGRQMVAGLAALHERGLFHRDIKPSNIWLESKDAADGGTRNEEHDRSDSSFILHPSSFQVKILDFGLVQAAGGDERLTWEGGLVGTPEYMAPEQVEGKTVDARSDLFSFGCVLYRLCTGRAPFQGAGTLAIFRALALEQPAPPRALNPAVPPALSELVLQLLAKDPSERPASTRDVLQALEAIGSPQPTAVGIEDTTLAVGPRPGGDARRARSQRATTKAIGWIGKRKYLATTAAVAFLIAASVLSLFLFHRRPDLPDQTANPFNAVPAPPGVLPDRSKPFLLLHAGGSGGEAFSSFDAALDARREGDIIEVRGDGPFAIRALHLGERTLMLRAAPGYWPVFVPRDESPGTVWLAADGVRVLAEGCDFRCRPGMILFKGEAAPWEFRNCRLLSDDRHWNHYSGPRLRFVDCLVQGLLKLEAQSELELTNNVWAGTLDICAPGGQRLRLEHNTFWRPISVAPPRACAPVHVQASGNIFAPRNGVHLFINGPHEEGIWRERLTWQGRDNLYGGAAGPTITYGSGTPAVVGLAAWNHFWKQDEPGAQEAPSLAFAWDEARLSPAEKAIHLLERGLASSRRRHAPGLADAGPAWHLLGPGEGYLRALAAAGNAIAAQDLRPRPLAGGPCTLWRQGQVQGAYAALTPAIQAAAAGDVIELRTDGPLAGFHRERKPPRDFALRAAPGYRPVIEGNCVLAADDRFAAEGIAFRGGLCVDDIEGRRGRIQRLANCWLERDGPEWTLNGALCTGDRQPARIENCLIRNGVLAFQDAGDQLLVRNTVVIGTFTLAAPRQGESRLQCDGCLFWNPIRRVFAPLGDEVRGRVGIAARRTVFMAGDGLVSLPRTASWKGTANVYALGLAPWNYEGEPLFGLETWQQHWKSPEQGSLEAEPVDYEPAMWKLLPQGPGHRLGADGKPPGADVDQVARGMGH
jgi:serine/threonine protein kinase